jgi:uncharacterized membrane protein
MLILVLKLIHVFTAFVFLGTGLGSAYYKLRADRSGELAVIAWAQREIVRADWIFTVPAGVLLPATGVWLTWLYGYKLTDSWILFGICGYVVAGIAWLPAAYLQIRMRRLADQALARQEPLPAAFHRAQRIWFLLGFPSFLAAIVTVWAMVAKHAFINMFR